MLIASLSSCFEENHSFQSHDLGENWEAVGLVGMGCKQKQKYDRGRSYVSESTEVDHTSANRHHTANVIKLSTCLQAGTFFPQLLA
jgi:hypothetical protein